MTGREADSQTARQSQTKMENKKKKFQAIMISVSLKKKRTFFFLLSFCEIEID